MKINQIVLCLVVAVAASSCSRPHTFPAKAGVSPVVTEIPAKVEDGVYYTCVSSIEDSIQGIDQSHMMTSRYAETVKLPMPKAAAENVLVPQTITLDEQTAYAPGYKIDISRNTENSISLNFVSLTDGTSTVLSVSTSSISAAELSATYASIDGKIKLQAGCTKASAEEIKDYEEGRQEISRQ